MQQYLEPYLPMTSEPPVRPNGDIKKIIDGTKERLEETFEETFEDRVNNISQDALKRIAEKLESQIAILLLELEGKVKLSNEVKKILLSDIKMSSAVNNIVQNIFAIEDIDFEIESIVVGYDPETPEWNPIEINLEIKSDDFQERLELKHRIVEKAFREINKEVRENIFIIGAI